MTRYTNGTEYHYIGDNVIYDDRTYYGVSESWLLSHGYEKVLPPQPRTPTEQEKALQRIAELKEELATYDYIGVKIATCVSTVDEYVNEINYAQSLRQQIRELEVVAYGE